DEEVGWVERSETHHSIPGDGERWVSLRSTHPTGYATNFLYNQRRPSWRRQTCPRTSRPVMLRLGMMTRRRCQVVDLAGRRFNPNVRMLMVVDLIDAMLPHLARAARCRPTHSGHLGAPHRLSRSSHLPRPREI